MSEGIFFNFKISKKNKKSEKFYENQINFLNYLKLKYLSLSCIYKHLIVNNLKNPK